MEQPVPASARLAGPRRTVLADAALKVLSTHGPSGFTHRNVDDAAGLPHGSVNYYAPTRARLWDLALNELFDQDFAVAAEWFNLESTDTVPGRSELVDRMVGFIAAMTTGEARARVVARHHLLGQAQHDQSLREAFDIRREGFMAFATHYIQRVNPGASLAVVEAAVTLLDGFMTRQVIIGRSALPKPVLREAFEVFVRESEPAAE
ncbi:TetR/AcrR family transcriptional regulator [Nocardia sp. NPDC057455]|uniref:TetR/AcrR family transcriptional regulator n=1 Tax=Nocardia sp. NPDC057455 TaxID=3346138 RepID=UPI003670F19F